MIYNLHLTLLMFYHCWQKHSYRAVLTVSPGNGRAAMTSSSLQLQLDQSLKHLEFPQNTVCLQLQSLCKYRTYPTCYVSHTKSLLHTDNRPEMFPSPVI